MLTIVGMARLATRPGIGLVVIVVCRSCRLPRFTVCIPERCYTCLPQEGSYATGRQGTQHEAGAAFALADYDSLALEVVSHLQVKPGLRHHFLDHRGAGPQPLTRNGVVPPRRSSLRLSAATMSRSTTPTTRSDRHLARLHFTSVTCVAWLALLVHVEQWSARVDRGCECGKVGRGAATVEPDWNGGQR